MSSLAASDHPEAPLFSDGVGERVVAADGATGELLQILRLRPALLAVPSFEFALRERTARLANFRHAYYARVRRVDRGMPPASSLAIVSDHIEGTRLSDILRVAHERGLQLDINAALCLIRQLVPAVAVLHENARDVAHGLLAPERLIVTPNARLVIAEHVLGAAIEQLQFGRDRLWQDFRIAMPPSAGLPRFDHRSDVTGMGLVALALILGRPLNADEFPHRIPALLNEARERSALGEEQPLAPPLRTWLSRALQVDVRRAFASAPEAMAAFEELVADDSMYVAAPVALETFLSRYSESLLEGPAPSRPPAIESSMASWHAALDAPPAPRPQAFDPPAPRHQAFEPPAPRHQAFEPPAPPAPRHQAFEPPALSFESFEAPTRLNRPGAAFRIDDDFATTTPFEQIPVNSWEDESTDSPHSSWEDGGDLPPVRAAGPVSPFTTSPICSVPNRCLKSRAPTIPSPPSGRSSTPTRRSPRPRRLMLRRRRRRRSVRGPASSPWPPSSLVLAGAGVLGIQVVRPVRRRGAVDGRARRAVESRRRAGLRGRRRARENAVAGDAEGRVAHPRAPRPRRAAQHSAHHHARRGSLAVPGVRRSAGQRAARRPVRACRRESAGRRRRARHRAADHTGPRRPAIIRWSCRATASARGIPSP